MNSDHTARVLDRAANTRHRVGRPWSRRLAALVQALITAVTAASLLACGDSDEDDAPPSSAWDEMRWDEGVWE